MASKDYPQEWEEQAEFVRRATEEGFAADLAYVPNDGKRGFYAQRLVKLMGISAGYPDLIFDRACGFYHGLRIEMKRKRGAYSWTPKGLLKAVPQHQRDRIQRLRDNCYLAVVAFGADEAMTILRAYAAPGDLSVQFPKAPWYALGVEYRYGPGRTCAFRFENDDRRLYGH